MGVKLSAFKDVGAEWVEFSAGFDLLLTSRLDPKYQAHRNRLLSRHMSRFRRGNIDFEITRNADLRAISKDVILDWRGLEDDEGKDIPYSPEACFKALKDHPKLMAEVDMMLLEREGIEEEYLEESAKNSSSSSNGPSNGELTGPPLKKPKKPVSG